MLNFFCGDLAVEEVTHRGNVSVGVITVVFLRRLSAKTSVFVFHMRRGSYHKYSSAEHL